MDSKFVSVQRFFFSTHRFFLLFIFLSESAILVSTVCARVCMCLLPCGYIIGFLILRFADLYIAKQNHLPTLRYVDLPWKHFIWPVFLPLPHARIASVIISFACRKDKPNTRQQRCLCRLRPASFAEISRFESFFESFCHIIHHLDFVILMKIRQRSANCFWLNRLLFSDNN